MSLLIPVCALLLLAVVVAVMHGKYGFGKRGEGSSPQPVEASRQGSEHGDGEV